LKYLDGVSSNIQTQINNLNDKTTKITYDGATDTTEIDSNLTVSDVFKVGNVIHTPGTNYIIKNNTNAGSMQIQHSDSGGTVRTLTIDQFINMSGINDLSCSKLYVSGSLINFATYDTTVANTQKITYNVGTDTTTISSKANITGVATFHGTLDIYGNTTHLNNVYFYDDIEIGGTANLIIGAITISKTELSYLDGLTSNIQTQLTSIGGDITGIESDITNISNRIVAMSYTGDTNISSKLNVTGDLSTNGKLTIGNITHTPGTNYIIKNNTNTGSIQIQHSDSGGTVRTLTIDQFINMSGINDLYANRLTIGNTLAVTNALTIGNITHTPGLNYIIRNNTNTGSVQIKNSDSGGNPYAHN
jgi:predicted metal-dependent enzyme (double-stranded beta helix superfamily)